MRIDFFTQSKFIGHAESPEDFGRIGQTLEDK